MLSLVRLILCYTIEHPHFHVINPPKKMTNTPSAHQWLVLFRDANFLRGIQLNSQIQFEKHIFPTLGFPLLSIMINNKHLAPFGSM